MFGIGIQTVIIVILALVCVILALALVKHKTPRQVVASAEEDLKAWGYDVGARVRAAEPSLTQFKLKAEDEAMALLERAQKWLTDTTAEDAKIAEAQAELQKAAEAVRVKIAEAEAAKATKRGALAAHIAALQPPTGS